jgi:hypothetical protein
MENAAVIRTLADEVSSAGVFRVYRAFWMVREE